MAAVSPPPPRRQETATIVYHDARATHDAASLRISDFEIGGHAVWILAKVLPGERSGSATVPGASFNARTGQLETPDNARTVVIKEGTWQAIATSPNEAKEGNYNWTEPLAQRQRGSAPEDFYSPFASGGAILFRPALGQHGIAQFGPLCLLFMAWAQYVQPAFDFAQQHPGLLDRAAPADVAQFRRLVPGTNELLAALAFRQLLLAGGLTQDDVRERLSGAKEYLDAVITYLILTNSGVPSKGPPLAEALDSVIRKSPALDKLRSISLGAFAAALFHSSDSKVTSQSKRLVETVRVRVKELGLRPQDDPYLLYLLSKMDLGQ